MPTIVFHPAAREEAIEAAHYLEASTPGLGKAYRDALQQALDDIAQFPQSARTL